MIRSTFSILFYIKRTKLLKNGKAPVYIKITVNGKSAEASIKRSITPSIWNTPKNRAKGNSVEAKELNSYLDSVRGQFYVYQQSFQEMGKTITSKLLINAFLGKGEKQWALVELFEQHNENMSTLGNSTFCL